MPRGLSLSLFLELKQLTAASPAARPEKKAATRSRGGGSGGLEASRGSEETAEEVFEAAFFSPPTRPLPRRGKKRVKSESEREERRTTTRARALQNSSFSLALSLAFLLFLSFSARCFGAHPLYPCLAQSSRPERPWRRREDGKRGGNQNFRLIIDQSTSKKKSKPWPLPSSSAESAPRCHSRTSSTWPQVREKKKMGKE